MITEVDMKRIQKRIDSFHTFGEKLGTKVKNVFKWIFKYIGIIGLVLFFGAIFSFDGFIGGVFKRKVKI